jgi:hypothetical protein
MKADLPAIVVISVIAAAIGALYIQDKIQETLSPDAQYEQDLDVLVDDEIAAVGLGDLPGALRGHDPGMRLDVLRAYYRNDFERARLRRGMRLLLERWETNYGAFAANAGRDYEYGRLEAELDERMGDGSYDLMLRRLGGDGCFGRGCPPDDPLPPPPPPPPRPPDDECERAARRNGAYVVCNTPEGPVVSDGRRRTGR